MSERELLTLADLGRGIAARIEKSPRLADCPAILRVTINAHGFAAKAIARGQHAELLLEIRMPEGLDTAYDLWAEDPVGPIQ